MSKRETGSRVGQHEYVTRGISAVHFNDHYLQQQIRLAALSIQIMESDTFCAMSATNQLWTTPSFVPQYTIHPLQMINMHYTDTCIDNATIFDTLSAAVSTNPMSLPTTNHHYIDLIVADANLFATQLAVISTITALSNTNRQLAMLDVIMQQNTLDVLVTAAINSEN